MDTSSGTKIQILILGVSALFLVVVGMVRLLTAQWQSSTAVILVGLGLVCANVLAGLWLRRGHLTANARYQKHCLAQLQQTHKSEERQRILDNMVALNMLQGTDLSGIDLSSANLKDANLNKADLSATKHLVTDLTGANLNGANLSYANLRYVTLNGADLSQANLNGATLNSSDLRSIRLVKANLRSASLVEADLRDSDLRDAILRHANLENANLENANLENADLNHCTLPDGSKWDPDTDLRKFTFPEHTVGWAATESLAQRLFSSPKDN